MHQQGQGIREISRNLKLARNTVRRILDDAKALAADGQPATGPVIAAPTCPERILAWLIPAFERVGGNGVRLQEMLLAELGENPGYSTLTRWIREAGLRQPPKRSGEYHFAPGQESQHDTSPHQVMLGGKLVATQCASSALAYSRMLFFQYYPRFTRFEAKQFLLEAACFMEGVCPVCVIDNTSVMVVAGSGDEAVFAPEMVAFASTLGFRFLAHRVNHPDRKGRIERPFAYIEGNFLAGRSFRDFADLNAQARVWCQTVSNAKPKRVLGMAPLTAYVQEKPYLKPLPAVLPPVYQVVERVVDLYGYVSLDTNRYSVPERLVGQALSVYQYPTEVRIVQRDQLVAVHPRLIGVRDGKQKQPEHHPLAPRPSRAPPHEATLLRGHSAVLDAYVLALVAQAHGRGVRSLRRLLELKRTYPLESFLAGVAQALQFGLFDLGRLETIILQRVAGDFFQLPEENDDA